jgi:DNA-binding MarR family transcriptional regulator
MMQELDLNEITALQPAQMLGLIVNDLARLLRKRFEQVARSRQLAVSRAQAAVIIHLARNEGINQVSLAQLMELEPITLVRLLDRLQAAGLIERRPDPHDRRARRLYLAPAAHPLLSRIKVLGNEVQAEALDGVAVADQEAFVQLLLTIKSNLMERTARHADQGGDIEQEQMRHG